MGRPLKNNPPLKSEDPFQEMFSGKKKEKSETVINTCVSVKTKMAEIPQERDFLTCSIQNFVKKSETVF